LNRRLRLLRLLQIFDSGFPVGAFAHSGGVETYAALGGSLGELRDILRAQIDLGWGRADLASACLAWRAAGEARPVLLAGLAARLDALKVVPAVRDTSVRLGRRTADLIARLYPEAAVEVTPSHHAVVIGAAGRRLGLPLEPMLHGYAQSLTSGTLAAAVRCMPISPAQAHQLLVELHPRIMAAVAAVLEDPHAAMFSFTPALDIRSAQQAHLRTRLFQS
jgi:urease accessory protein